MVKLENTAVKIQTTYPSPAKIAIFLQKIQNTKIAHPNISKWATIGLPAKRHYNGVSLAGPDCGPIVCASWVVAGIHYRLTCKSLQLYSGNQDMLVQYFQHV